MWTAISSISDEDTGCYVANVARHTPNVLGLMYIGSKCSLYKLQLVDIIYFVMNAELKSRIVQLLFGAMLFSAVVKDLSSACML